MLLKYVNFILPFLDLVLFLQFILWNKRASNNLLLLLLLNRNKWFFNQHTFRLNHISLFFINHINYFSLNLTTNNFLNLDLCVFLNLNNLFTTNFIYPHHVFSQISPIGRSTLTMCTLFL